MGKKAARKSPLREPRPPLKDAVRNAPKVVISAAELRTQLMAWIAIIDGGARDPAHPTPRSGRIDNAADLVYEMQSQIESWVEELEEEDM